MTKERIEITNYERCDILNTVSIEVEKIMNSDHSVFIVQDSSKANKCISYTKTDPEIILKTYNYVVPTSHIKGWVKVN